MACPNILDLRDRNPARDPSAMHVSPIRIAPGTLLLDGTKRTRSDDTTAGLSASRIYRGVLVGDAAGYDGFAQALAAAQQLSWGFGDDANVIAVVKQGASYFLFSAMERTLDRSGRFTRDLSPVYMEPTDGGEQVIDRVLAAHEGLRALVDGDYVQRFRPGRQ